MKKNSIELSKEQREELLISAKKSKVIGLTGR